MLAAAVEALVLKEDDRIVVLIRGEQGVEGVLRIRGVERLEAGEGKVGHLEFLRVERTEGQAAAARETKHDRGFLPGAEMVGGGVEHDLGGGVGGEIGELELLDGTVAVDGEAKGIARAGGFAQRCAEHPGPAEIVDQALGDLEGAAISADVLAEHDRLGPLGEDLAQAEGEGLGHGDIFDFGFLAFARTDRRNPGHGSGRGGKDIGHHPLRADGRQRQGGLDRGLDEVPHLGVDRLEGGAVAGGGEFCAELGERVLREDRLGFAGLHVVAGVVGGMAAQAEGVRLDEERPAGGAGAVDGGGEGAEDDGRVTAIHFQALHAVALGALEEIGRGELLAHRGRVGVAVVLDDKNHGHGQHGREVQRLVDVARAGGAVAEESEADRGPAEAALRIGGADDIRQHDAEMGDHRQAPGERVAVVDVALAGLGRAAAVGEILAEVVAQVPTPDQVAAEAAVGETDHVDGLVGEQGERHDEGLVTLAAGDGAANQSLAEKIENAVVASAGELHPGVGAQQALRPVQFRSAQIAALETARGRGEVHRSESAGRLRRLREKTDGSPNQKSRRPRPPAGLIPGRQARPTWPGARNSPVAARSAGTRPCPAACCFRLTRAPAKRNI